MITITHPFESSYLSAHTPNFIIFNEVDTLLTAYFQSEFLKTPLTLKYQPINGYVKVNILEVTKQIYSQIKEYEDPFKYETDVLYSDGDNYHYGILNVSFTDKSENVFNFSLNILNNSLQVNESLNNAFYLNKRLGVYCNATEIQNIPESFSYDLNMDLHDSNGAVFEGGTTLVSEKVGLPIWEGYPHTTSVLRDTGIERILDYHPTIKPVADLTHSIGFIKGCKGIYLKWLNTQGGYSYWLFSDVFTESKRHKSLGEVQNHWTQRGSGKSNSIFLGKNSNYEMRVFSKIPFSCMREVASILDSPEVYLYTDDSQSCTSYLENYEGFVRVQIKDGTTQIRNSKYTHTDLRLRLEFPQRFNQKLI